MKLLNFAILTLASNVVFEEENLWQVWEYSWKMAGNLLKKNNENLILIEDYMTQEYLLISRPVMFDQVTKSWPAK